MQHAQKQKPNDIYSEANLKVHEDYSNSSRHAE